MGLFGFGRDKPRTPAQIVATIDLARARVCELGREDDRASIERRLGTPTKTEKTGLLYDQIGLFINVEKSGAMTGWSVFFSREILGHFTWGDRRIPTPPTEADVVALLGPPTKRETDEEELMLTWERGGGLSIVVDYSLAGALNDVMVDFT